MLKGSKLLLISMAALSFLSTVNTDSALNQMRAQIKGMYNDFEDFPKVVAYSNRQAEMYKPLVIIALFERMRELGHHKDVLNAIPLYESIVRNFFPKMKEKYRVLLNQTKYGLINDIIIPRGASLLERGDIVNITRFVDWMKCKNNTIIRDQIIDRYWDNVRVKSPDPIAHVAKTSKELRHNLFFLLSLYKKHKEGGIHDDEFIDQMRSMTKKQEFKSTVNKETQEEVLRVIASHDSSTTTKEGPETTTISDKTTSSTSTKSSVSVATTPMDSSSLPSADPKLVKEIEGMYHNLTDLQKVIDYITNQFKADDRGKYLVALFHVMNELKDLNNVFGAIPIHDEIVRRLDLDGKALPIETQLKLDMLKTYLVENVIMPQSVDMLVNQKSRRDVAKLIDLIYNSTDTLAEQVVADYWKVIEKNKEVDPVQRVGKVSPYARQNIYMILMLYRMNKFNDRRLAMLHEVLKLIMLNPTYRTVPSEHRRQVEEIYELTSSYEILHNVIRLYAENFDNYGKVIKYMDDCKGIERKGFVVIALYEVMKKANHLNELFRMLELYKTVEERLNTKPHQLTADQIKKLNEIREELLVGIKADSNSVLGMAVKNGKGNTVANSLLKTLVALGNRTILQETLGEIWAKVAKENDDPVGKMIAIGETLEQKVQILLALLDLEGLSQEHILRITDELAQMKNAYGYEDLPGDLKARVELAVTKIWFLRKVVSIYKPDTVGEKIYFLQQCSEKSNQACVAKTKNHMRLFLPYTTNQSHLKLGIPHYRNHLCLKKLLNERDGRTLNVYTVSEGNDDFYWYAEINHDDNTVIFSDEAKRQFLCSDINEANAYTRKRETFKDHQSDCAWKVEVWV